MAYGLTNVQISSDTFATWIEKTNLGLDLLSTKVLHAEANSAGGSATGNTTLNGTLRANTIAAETVLRGGNVTTTNTLYITSAVDLSNTFINVLSTNANVTIGGSGKFANVIATSEFRGNVHIVTGTANVWVNPTKTTLAGTNTDVISTELNVYNNTAQTVKMLSIAQAANSVAVIANTFRTTATSDFVANSGNVNFNASNTTIGNSSVFGVRVTNDGTTTTVTVAGNTANLAANLIVTAANADVRNVTFNAANTTLAGSGNLVISVANTNISSNTALSGANVTYTSATNVKFLGNVYFTTDVQHIVVANTDLGSNVSSAQTVYSFDKSVYTAAEITATAKKGSNTQISRFLVAYDSTSNVVLSTMYGTITSPAAANIGILQSSVNATAVNIGYYQNAANSSVKLILNLVK